jgi:hypothetical protein
MAARILDHALFATYPLSKLALFTRQRPYALLISLQQPCSAPVTTKELVNMAQDPQNFVKTHGTLFSRNTCRIFGFADALPVTTNSNLQDNNDHVTSHLGSLGNLALQEHNSTVGVGIGQEVMSSPGVSTSTSTRPQAKAPSRLF